jgi:hypothetical protein
MSTESARKPYIETMLLADHAEAVNGKLYINGGAFTNVNLADMESPYTCFLALVLRIPWSDTNRRLSFRGWIESVDGAELEGWSAEGQLESGRPAGTRGEELNAVLVMPVQLRAPHGQPGDVIVNFQFAESVERRRVKVQPALQPPFLPAAPG